MFWLMFLTLMLLIPIVAVVQAWHALRQMQLTAGTTPLTYAGEPTAEALSAQGSAKL